MCAAVLLSLERICYLWIWRRPAAFRYWCARPTWAWLGEPVDALCALFSGFKVLQCAVFFAWCLVHDGDGALLPLSGGLTAIGMGAVLIAAGILARRWARATGDVLIAIGALPLTVSIAALEDSVLRVVAAATLLVTIVAFLDAADARSLAGRANSARRWLLAAATAAAATVAGLGMARAHAASVVVLSVMSGITLLAVLAIVGYRHRRRPT